MKQQRKVTTYYKILLILVVIISKTNVSQAQEDTLRVRQYAETAHKAYEVANKNKERLVADGKWNLSKIPGMVYLRRPIEEMPGMHDYGSFHIPFCVDHSPLTNDYADFFNTWNETYTHSYNGSTGTLFEYAHSGYGYLQSNAARVVAAADGIILAKGDGNFDQNCSFTAGNGNYLIIEHSDGRRTGYFHLRSSLITQKTIGEYIAAGEPIGFPGGLHGTFLQLPVSANLYFELRDANNNAIDPFGFPYTNPANRVPSSWLDSTTMVSLVGSSVLKYLKTMKHTPVTSDNCGEPNYIYSDHFNPGDSFYIRYAITNYDSYNDSVIINVFNPLGVPILPTHIRPRICINCGSFVHLITAIQYVSYVLPVNPTLMIQGTYTVVLNIPDPWTGGYKTFYHYFTVGCVSTYTLSSIVNGEYGRIAGNTIFSTQQCNTNSRVKYVAGNEIILQPGFNAYDGSHVMIYTEPCVVPSRLSGEDVTLLEVEKDRILVAPNPARDFLTVKIVDSNSKAIFKIYNSTFQLVKVLNVENASEQMISLAEFENGIYFIDAQANGQSYKAKFVVNK